MTDLDHRGMVGRIYVDHITLLQTELVSPGPHGFRDEDFCMFFSYTSPYKHMTPWDVASLDPSGLIGRIFVGGGGGH